MNSSNEIELRRAPQRLDHLIGNSIESIEQLVRAKGHDIAVHFSARPLIVMGDPQRLVQCFGNILANAAKYTPPRARSASGRGMNATRQS